MRFLATDNFIIDIEKTLKKKINDFELKKIYNAVIYNIDKTKALLFLETIKQKLHVRFSTTQGRFDGPGIR